MFYKFLSEKAQTWLDQQLRGETWASVWKQNPENAVRIWNEHCPYVSEDRNTTPSFIFSLQYQDEIAAANK